MRIVKLIIILNKAVKKTRAIKDSIRIIPIKLFFHFISHSSLYLLGPREIKTSNNIDE